MREGKNREVKNVLGHLGLAVNRLIRVSFGPFQLGELPEGAVEEVRTRHLREQLGERIAARGGRGFRRADRGARAASRRRRLVAHPEARAPRASKGDGADGRRRSGDSGARPASRAAQARGHLG